MVEYNPVSRSTRKSRNFLVRALQTLILMTLAAATLLVAPATAKDGLIVFSAASAAAAVEEIAADFSKTSGLRVRVSSAASSVLARQIAAGAEADVFITANQDWMDWAEARDLIERTSIADLMSNRLVLAGAPSLPFDLAAAIRKAAEIGRIAMGDPDHVPVGQYGKAALQHLGLWETVRGRLARTPNAVAAVALIARREVAAGIVYATDVRLSQGLRIIADFPSRSYPPIRYQVALVRGPDTPGRRRLMAALLSEAGQRTFAAHGFAARREN